MSQKRNPRCYIGEGARKGGAPIANLETVTNEEVPWEHQFRQIYDTHYHQILRQVNCLLGDRALAEDVAQEVFLKFYSCPPSQLDNPGGWLSRVAANLAYNFLRSEKRRRLREARVEPGQETFRECPEEKVFRRQEAALVREVLEQLPPRDRTCLILRFTGYSYEDIAGIIGVEKSSVGTILARARARFKEKYLRRKGR